MGSMAGNAPVSETTTNGYRITANVTWPGTGSVSCNVDHGGMPCPGLDPDPLTVIPDAPCHTTGRLFRNPLVREMLRAFGIRICSACDRFVGVAERQERNLRPKGSGWRER